jgi:hypothetical protein
MEGAMGLTEAVAMTLAIPVKEVGSLRLVSRDDAELFLDACAMERIRVLGVEGFRLHQGTAVPDIDAIADFSELDAPDRAIVSVAEARRFVRLVGSSDMMFDFTLAKEESTDG